MALPPYSKTCPVPPATPIRAEQREDDVLGRHAGVELPLHPHLERLRAALEEALGGEDVLDLGGADPEGERAEGAVVAVWLSPHTIVIPGWVRPSSGPMTWTIPWCGEPMPWSGIPNSAQLSSRPLHLGGGHDVDDRQAAVGGRDRMVGRGQGLAGAPDPEAAGAQPVEGLRARHLVDEVQVDAEHVGHAGISGRHHVLVPDLVDDRSRGALAHRSGHPSGPVKRSGSRRRRGTDLSSAHVRRAIIWIFLGARFSARPERDRALKSLRRGASSGIACR